MTQVELLALVIATLNQLNIPHMLVGSHASSVYGEPRSTHDIDLVIDLPPSLIPDLVAAFDSSRYYLSESALREGRMANLIDNQTGDKADLFILGDDPQDRIAFERRTPANVLGTDVDLASVEDTILSKCRWNDMIGGSQRQENDIRQMLIRQRDSLNWSYLRTQAEQGGLLESLERLTHP